MPLNTVLVLILLGGWMAGKCFQFLRLPAVLGMLCCGILLGLGGETLWPQGLQEMAPFLKSFALVVILLRAGLGLRRQVLNRVGTTALKLAVIPCLLEAVTLTLLLHFGWAFSWVMAGLTACMLSAVSPAVVVPAMLNLSEQGLGRKNEVPTLVLAGASVDDVLAITLFSIFTRLAIQPERTWIEGLWMLPQAVLLGILPGLLIGSLLVSLFRKHLLHTGTTEKTLILLTSGLLLVEVGNLFQSAALLGVMTLGFLLLERAEPVAHDLAKKLAGIWVFAEITLFVLIGMQVDPTLALQAGLPALALLAAGLLMRSLGVWVATCRSPLSNKERLFCVLAYLPKATVQAALGGVALHHQLPHGETILAVAVLSILFTAPVGLLAIRYGGPRLLESAP
jgi:NhaP-type Na+/H+ or K+/H+ antiporter